MERQAEKWIASSLSLLAMTRKDMRSHSHSACFAGKDEVARHPPPHRFSNPACSTTRVHVSIWRTISSPISAPLDGAGSLSRARSRS